MLLIKRITANYKFILQLSDIFIYVIHSHQCIVEKY
jgi:hypothetical protein